MSLLTSTLRSIATEDGSAATGIGSRHELHPAAVGVEEAVLDEGNGQGDEVDADPPAAQLLGGVNRRAAAAEGIQDDVAGIAAGLDDPLQQGDGDVA
jgi:hypothetical protein